MTDTIKSNTEEQEVLRGRWQRDQEVRAVQYTKVSTVGPDVYWSDARGEWFCSAWPYWQAWASGAKFIDAGG